MEKALRIALVTIVGSLAGLMIFGLAGVLSIPFYWLTGVVLKHLWAWFVAPVFGVPTLSTAQAVGISIVGGFVANRPQANDYETKSDGPKKTAQKFGLALIYILSVWFSGYILHTYFMA